MDRYKVFPSGELGMHPTGNWTPYADAQATVEALQAHVKTARHDAVRAFVRGDDKMCLVCGAKEPCELKDDPCSPCTFDPTPMELKQQVEALQRERDDALHAANGMSNDLTSIGTERDALQAALDAEREKVKIAEGYRKDAVERAQHNANKAQEYQLQLSQLQALVRALPVYVADTLITVDGDLDEIDRPALRSSVMELLEYRATLDAERGQE